MKLAANRLKNLGWLALVLIVAISLYPLSLSVASVRSDLSRTEAKIVAAKARLRYLETEFATRASMRQLELWNAVDYGYAAPEAAQYISGERELANLSKGRDHMHDIVEVAMVSVDDAAGSIGSPFGDGIAIPKAGDDKEGSDVVAATEADSVAESASGAAAASASGSVSVAIDLPKNAPTIEDLLEANNVSSSSDAAPVAEKDDPQP
ncbi:MAG: colicin transporter [Pseudomonadota bacterium]